MQFRTKRGLAIFRLIVGVAVVVLAGIASLLTYRTYRSDMTARLYRQRLQELAGEYEALRERYNTAITRSAITELVVTDDWKLSVAVRSADGVIETVTTPYDPQAEIYVDYAVIDGRIWIRRIFDEYSPPSSATVIDPKLYDIEWDAHAGAVGKAVYRSLSPGRWIITVSGNGSLGLTKVDERTAVELVNAPEVREFEELDAQIVQEIDEISPLDLLRPR